MTTALEHGPGCECTRCRGFEPGNEHRFEPGNDVAVRHGAHSAIRLQARAQEIAKDLWDVLPSKAPAFFPAVQAAAIAAARVEAAAAALAELDDPRELPSLDTRLRLWITAWVKTLDALGLTPRSAAELRLHVAAGDQAKATLEKHLAAEHGRGEPT